MQRNLFIGNVVAAPELLPVGEGKTRTSVARVRVASNEVYIDRESGERKEIATFLPFEIWGRSAENAAKLMTTGRSVVIDYVIRNTDWIDKNTGEKRYRDVYRVMSWRLIGPRPDGSNDGDEGGSQTPGYSVRDFDGAFPGEFDGQPG